MKSIIEISIKGNIFFIENTLTNDQLIIIEKYISKNFQKSTDYQWQISSHQFVTMIWNEKKIKLIPVHVDHVIAI